MFELGFQAWLGKTAADFEDPEEAESELRGFDYIATYELRRAR